MTKLKNILRRIPDQWNPKVNGKINFCIGLENIESQTGRIVGNISADNNPIKSTKSVFNSGDILYGKLRPNLNKVWYADKGGICSTDILVLRPVNSEIDAKFYSIVLLSKYFNVEVLKSVSGAQMPRTSYQHLSSIDVPLVPYDTQIKYVSEIYNQENIVDANKKLVEIMENKIKDTLEQI